MTDSRPSHPIDITAINFFPAFAPPRSGGEMRYFHLYSRLARLGFRVEMINPTHPFVQPETVEHGPGCVEYRIPQTMAHHRIYHFMQKVLRQGECSGAVISLGLRFHRAFVEKARESVRRSRIVIFDFPLPWRPFLKGADGHDPLVVHNSYNVEGRMLRSTLVGPQGRLIADWVGRNQRRLCRRSDLVFACGHEDADAMTRLYDLDPTMIYIIPNGVCPDEIGAVSPDEGAVEAARRGLGLPVDRPVALFLGSHHGPNIEAARFLMNRVAPACPEFLFVVAGSVCGELGTSAPENVRLFGPFENAQKGPLLQAASVAVNPMFSGSGTNLKMLEFFAAGLPVLSTPFGARGLGDSDGANCFALAEPDAFAESLRRLVAAPEERLDLARSARRQALEKWNWDRIAENAAQILRHKTERRVLVLNDFPVTPAKFGGQVRMFHQYRMAGRSLNVTILTMTRSRRFQRRIPAPGVEEINIPENWLKTLANKSLYALLGASADDLAACMTARFHPALRRAFERESRRAKVIVLTHPYMTNLARVVRNKPILYESLNVETDLKAVLFGPRFWGRWAARMVRRCEERAVYMSRAVAACSTENADSFRALFPEAMRDPAGDVKPVILAPNGVLCRAHWLACGWTNAATPETLDAPPPIDRAALKRRAGLADETVAVFLGSGHPPNQRAALFIIEKLAPRHPNVLFLILGGVCWAVHDRIVPSNVLLLYECDETLKNRVLGMADIALNPLSEGSGVSLKTMDCLAAGATILSTEVGARGVDIQDGANGLIRPLEGFDEALEELAKDPARRHSLGEAGRLLAWRRYDWNITSRAFIETLENWVLEQENG